jgi:hypothetical protein
MINGHAGSDVDSALYASAFCFGKRTALGVQGAAPFAHAMSKTLPKCALAFRFEPLISAASSYTTTSKNDSAGILDDAHFSA